MRIELFGVARVRAGTEAVNLPALDVGDLASALRALERAVPALVPEVLRNGRLTEHFIANLNGTTFLSDGATRLGPDDTLLIISAQAGG